jgi:hypothetical protein
MRKPTRLPTAKSCTVVQPWPTRRTICLLSGLATLAVLIVNVPTNATAEPYRHVVPALLVTDAPTAETVLPDRISPPTNTAVERIAAPMSELARPRPRRTRIGIQLASLGGSDIPAKRSSITEGAVHWGHRRPVWTASGHQRGGVALRSREGQLHLPQSDPQRQGGWRDAL